MVYVPADRNKNRMVRRPVTPLDSACRSWMCLYPSKEGKKDCCPVSQTLLDAGYPHGLTLLFRELQDDGLLGDLIHSPAGGRTKWRGVVSRVKLLKFPKLR